MIFRREPALFLGAVQTLVALAVSFGLDLTTQQVGAIMAATSAILALLARKRVYSAYQVNHAMKPSPEDIGPGGIGPAAVTPPTD